jgi:hypothetical protein
MKRSRSVETPTPTSSALLCLPDGEGSFSWHLRVESLTLVGVLGEEQDECVFALGDGVAAYDVAAFRLDGRSAILKDIVWSSGGALTALHGGGGTSSGESVRFEPQTLFRGQRAVTLANEAFPSIITAARAAGRTDEDLLATMAVVAGYARVKVPITSWHFSGEGEDEEEEEAAAAAAAADGSAAADGIAAAITPSLTLHRLLSRTPRAKEEAVEGTGVVVSSLPSLKVDADLVQPKHKDDDGDGDGDDESTQWQSARRRKATTTIV